MDNKSVLARLEAEIALINKTLQELNNKLASVREDKAIILSIIRFNKDKEKMKSEILSRLKSRYRNQ
jgi:uncharacterized protein (UPF0335 family)